MKKMLMLAAALLVCGTAFAKPEKIDFSKDPYAKTLTKECTYKDGVLTITGEKKGNHYCSRMLDVKKYAGKTLTFTAEVKCDIPECRQYMGGRMMLNYLHPKKVNGAVKDEWEWPSAQMNTIQKDWKPVKLVVKMPADAKQIQILFGIQDGRGTISYRNIVLDDGTK